MGSAARVLQEIGGARDVVGLARHEADVAQVRVALGAKAFAAAWAAGEALTWQQAIEKALEDGEHGIAVARAVPGVGSFRPNGPGAAEAGGR